LAIKLWRHIEKREGRRVRNVELLPFEPRFVATELLGLDFEEPEEIGSVASGNSVRVEVAGLLERPSRKIMVARTLKPEIRRFTGAHEIGHYLLHPDVTALRESPTTDAVVRSPFRSLREKEADLFAEEFLMPRRVLCEVFSRLFGEPLVSARLDDRQAFYLTSGKLLASELSRMELLELAKLVAGESSFISADARCLTDIFGVSSTAMAVHLLRLRLVS